MVNLIQVYEWYLDDLHKTADIASLFSEELSLSQESELELFEAISEDMLTADQLLVILSEHYETLFTFELMVEETETSELIRKSRIERQRKKLGQQFRGIKGDTAEQKLNKSVLSLQTFTIDKEGHFKQRKSPGDAGKIRANLMSKRARFLATQAKISAQKATEKRKKQTIGGGKKVGAGKFARSGSVAKGSFASRTSRAVGRIAA